MLAHQNEILKGLEKISPPLAALYQGAVQILSDSAFPGRVRFIAHAVREIRNRLPEVIAGKIVRPRLEYRKELKPIISEWEAAGVLGIDAQEKEPNKAAVEDTIQVPRKLAVMIGELIKKHKDVSFSQREKVKALLLAIAPENADLQTSLEPVIDHWCDITEWFMERTHETLDANIDTDGKELSDKFWSFEEALRALIGLFYPGLEEIERIVKAANESMEQPNQGEVERALSLLIRPQYRAHFFATLENPSWLIPLKEKGFFGNPPEPLENQKEGIVSFPNWPETTYLKRVASKRPEEVMAIVTNLKTQNPRVKKGCLEAILEMPVDDAAKGIAFVCDAIKSRGWQDWIFVGKPGAQLMAMLAEKHVDEALKIAWPCLELWKAEDRRRVMARDIAGRFPARQYSEFIFKYYMKLVDREPAKGVWVLVKTFDRYLDQLNKVEGYDASEHLYISIENLDSIQRLESDYRTIIVKAICEAGKTVIEKEPDRIDELLDFLGRLKKAIFQRIAMYLLRFVPAGTKKRKIAEIIGNTMFLDTPGYEYEYRFLLRDKFEDVEENARKVFLNWVEEQGIDDIDDFKASIEKTEGHEATAEDIDRITCTMKARQLYLVRERFPEIYSEYKTKASASDSDLRPKPMIGPARFVSPTEGSPKSVEELLDMGPRSVLAYISDPSNWRSHRKRHISIESPEDALAAAFKEAVKKKPADYISADINEKLLKLPTGFLSAYYYGVSELKNGETWERRFWEPLLDLTYSLATSGKNNVQKRCSSAILSLLHKGYSNDGKGIEFRVDSITKLWEILESLVRCEEEELRTGERDPIQMRCSSTNGKALEQIVMLGIACKHNFGAFFEEWLKPRISGTLDYVLQESTRAEVICTLGIDLVRILWLTRQWVEENLEMIFANEVWDAVWGAYVSWATPSRGAFELLFERGIYREAVNLLGEPNRCEFQKNPQEGLAEHLMIAFFNGWLEEGDEGLARQFLQKAEPGLRGYAADFLATGFESLSKNPNEGASRRLKWYWEQRLEKMAEDPENGSDEAEAFLGWIKNSPFGDEETFQLLFRTLKITGGSIGEGGNGYDFLSGICEKAKGNELMALRCLNEAMNDQQIYFHFSSHETELVTLMESVVNMEKSYPDFGETLKEALKLADACGQKGMHFLRPVFKQLSERADES